MSTRKMKRFATIAAIAMIASCVAMPMAAMTASAAETANITMTQGAADSVYVAYKLLNLTTSDTNGDLTPDNYAYTLNTKYEAALKSVTGKTTEKEIIAYLESIKGNATKVRDFADAMYAEVRTMAVDATSTDGVFAGVAQGYYLIAESVLGTDDDTFSLVMLDTNGGTNIEVETKEDTPSLEKKLKEKNDSTGVESNWQDGADYDLGDAIPFKLTGSISGKYAEYEEYFYAFHDTYCAGLTFNKDSVKVTIDEVEIDKSLYEVVEGAGTFEVRFKDLKDVDTAIADLAIDGDSVVVVEYTATLNENAVIGSEGNENVAYLEYSNNPYFVGNGTDADTDGKDDGSESGSDKDGIDNDGDGEVDEEGETGEETTSETPKDEVRVYTYQVDVNKVDDKKAPLAGAGFTLYKWDASVEGEDKYVAVGAEQKAAAGETMTTFTWKRLDAGKYKLVETTVPGGYTKAEDLEFTVDATYDTEDDAPEFGTLTAKQGETVISSDTEAGFIFTSNQTNGTLGTTVENKPGSLLPSTGGIGTTIFYVVGGTMAAGAGVYLISKKRMKKDEE